MPDSGHTSLKPCPFCGGEAEYREVERPIVSNTTRTMHYVCCPDHQFHEAEAFSSDNREKAVARWNTRAPDPSHSALIEALEDDQWEVVMGALDKWSNEGGSPLVALGIIGCGLLKLDELRDAALTLARKEVRDAR